MADEMKIILGAVATLAVGLILFFIKSAATKRENEKKRRREHEEKVVQEKRKFYEKLFNILSNLKEEVAQDEFDIPEKKESFKQLENLYAESEKSFLLDSSYILLLNTSILSLMMSVTLLMSEKDKKARSKKVEELFSHVKTLKGMAK